MNESIPQEAQVANILVGVRAQIERLLGSEFQCGLVFRQQRPLLHFLPPSSQNVNVIGSQPLQLSLILVARLQIELVDRRF